MNTECHHHITWLIAARAGLPPDETRIIAYSSQSTDDNDMIGDFDKCIGHRDQANTGEERRIERYPELSSNPAYGGP